MRPTRSALRRPRALAYSSLLLITMSACDPGPESEDEFFAEDDPAEERILNGVDAGWAGYDAVLNHTHTSFCTGTLVGDRYVLTAGHCVNRGPDPVETPGVWYPVPGRTMTVRIGADRTAPEQTVTATHYNSAGYEDIMLLRLDSPVPSSVATPAVPLTDVPGGGDPLAWLQSQTFMMMGFGTAEGGVLPDVRRRAWGSVATFPTWSFGVLVPNRARIEGDSCATVLGGDSGSPLLWYDYSTGVRHVVGVAQGTEACGGRYTITFGQGGFDSNGDARPDVGDWLETAIPVDFVLDGPISVACTGPGGSPAVIATVKNQGLTPGAAWFDVFVGEPSAPSIGTLSTMYDNTGPLAPGESRLMSVPVPSTWQNQSAWVDVLLDTTQSVAEGNESNNHAERFVTFPDCSFG